MRAWHYLSIANLLLAAVTLAAVVTFRFVPVPVQVTVAAPQATPSTPGRVRFEYARFSYFITDDKADNRPELEWVDDEGIKIAEVMPSLLNQMAKSKNRFPRDVSAGLIDLMNLAGELGWELVDVQDFNTIKSRLMEMYFRRTVRPR